MISIRKAKSEDSKIVYSLIKDLAIHHNQVKSLKTNPQELARILENRNESCEVLLAYYKNEIAGYLSYYTSYSIWLGKNYLNIDDVFVIEKFRSKSIGQVLMRRIEDISKKLSIDTIRWEVETDNFRAIRFYKNLGATMYNKGIFKWNINEQKIT